MSLHARWPHAAWLVAAAVLLTGFLGTESQEGSLDETEWVAQVDPEALPTPLLDAYYWGSTPALAWSPSGQRLAINAGFDVEYQVYDWGSDRNGNGLLVLDVQRSTTEVLDSDNRYHPIWLDDEQLVSSGYRDLILHRIGGESEMIRDDDRVRGYLAEPGGHLLLSDWGEGPTWSRLDLATGIEEEDVLRRESDRLPSSAMDHCPSQVGDLLVYLDPTRLALVAQRGDERVSLIQGRPFYWAGSPVAPCLSPDGAFVAWASANPGDSDQFRVTVVPIPEQLHPSSLVAARHEPIFRRALDVLVDHEDWGSVTIGLPSSGYTFDDAVAACVGAGLTDCDPTRWSPLHPNLRISLEGPFGVDTLEVTRGQYKACAGAGACAVPDEATCQIYDGEDWRAMRAAPEGQRGDEYPQTCVTRAEAQAFCQWVGGDLPSEAQWRAAASSYIYPWGSRFDARLVTSEATEPRGLTPVGSYPPLRYNILRDVVGNAAEWVLDDYCSITEIGALGADPVCVRDGMTGVVRGGSYLSDAVDVQVFHRAELATDARLHDVGFRCAVPIGIDVPVSDEVVAAEEPVVPERRGELVTSLMIEANLSGPDSAERLEFRVFSYAPRSYDWGTEELRAELALLDNSGEDTQVLLLEEWTDGWEWGNEWEFLDQIETSVGTDALLFEARGYSEESTWERLVFVGMTDGALVELGQVSGNEVTYDWAYEGEVEVRVTESRTICLGSNEVWCDEVIPLVPAPPEPETP